MCQPFCHARGGIVFPEEPGQNILLDYLYGGAIPLRARLPLTEIFNRMVLYHEAFGHGTESAATAHNLNINRELRADIAAIVGICRDTGGTKAAQALIAIRNLSVLRLIHPGYRPDPRLPADPAFYAIGPALRQVLSIVEQNLASIREMDDASLLGFINRTSAKFEMDAAGFTFQKNALLEARIIGLDAARGRTDRLDELKAHNPPLGRQARHWRHLAAEALCHLFEVEPPRAARCKAPGPAPKP